MLFLFRGYRIILLYQLQKIGVPTVNINRQCLVFYFHIHVIATDLTATLF